MKWHRVRTGYHENAVKYQLREASLAASEFCTAYADRTLITIASANRSGTLVEVSLAVLGILRTAFTV